MTQAFHLDGIRIARTLLIFLLTLSSTAHAQLNYMTNNGIINITGYTGQESTLMIPSTINGLPVASIAGQSFRDSSVLVNISIPASVTNIGVQALTGCSNLLAINVDDSNAFYSSVDGVLFDKSHTTLIQYPGAKVGTYEIPRGITNLAVGPFAFSVGLTAVIIPKSVTALGSFTFYKCANLSAAYFKGDAPSYGSGALDFDPHVIAFYLPHTTGWGSTFAGHPTVIWPPQLRLDAKAFGANQFGFFIDWASDEIIVIEACTNISNPAWQPIGTNTLAANTLAFSDPDWATYPARFYRVRTP